ncbi:TIGR03617 family F420-dependent LLM class oxidoreductase [Streptomyces sp. NPDC001255]|uniref:TIGR03617 family F420-dependent LLM class oxidoreductase n=1 Tax=Streptomyces sp. NPDC001255 TaxID=3364550 RepID=UPI0036851C98
MHMDLILPPHAADPRTAAESAERAGFDGLWTSEVSHDPFLPLALAAGATRRLTLGTSIAVAFARNPMTTAVVADDLQGLSGGRFSLGLGSQVRAHITRRFSMPWSRPAARMREYILALRAIWAARQQGEPLDFRGEFYEHTLLTPMFVPAAHGHPPPPVLLAAVGEEMTRVAGEVADGLLVHSFTTERYLREVTLPALARARGTLGGFERVGCPFLVTGRTAAERAAAAKAVRQRIAFYGSTPAYRPVLALHGWEDLATELHALSRAGHWQRMGEAISDEVLDAFAVAGEPARVASELVSRYGDVLTRVPLHTLNPVPADVFTEIAEVVRAQRGRDPKETK